MEVSLSLVQRWPVPFVRLIVASGLLDAHIAVRMEAPAELLQKHILREIRWYHCVMLLAVLQVPVILPGARSRDECCASTDVGVGSNFLIIISGLAFVFCQWFLLGIGGGRGTLGRARLLRHGAVGNGVRSVSVLREVTGVLLNTYQRS